MRLKRSKVAEEFTQVIALVLLLIDVFHSLNYIKSNKLTDNTRLPNTSANHANDNTRMFNKPAAEGRIQPLCHGKCNPVQGTIFAKALAGQPGARRSTDKSAP